MRFIKYLSSIFLIICVFISESHAFFIQKSSQARQYQIFLPKDLETNNSSSLNTSPQRTEETNENSHMSKEGKAGVLPRPDTVDYNKEIARRLFNEKYKNLPKIIELDTKVRHLVLMQGQKMQASFHEEDNHEWLFDCTPGIKVINNSSEDNVRTILLEPQRRGYDKIYVYYIDKSDIAYRVKKMWVINVNVG